MDLSLHNPWKPAVENEDAIKAAPTGDALTISWVIRNLIANLGATYIRGLTVAANAT